MSKDNTPFIPSTHTPPPVDLSEINTSAASDEKQNVKTGSFQHRTVTNKGDSEVRGETNRTQHINEESDAETALTGRPVDKIQHTTPLLSETDKVTGSSKIEDDKIRMTIEQTKTIPEHQEELDQFIKDINKAQTQGKLEEHFKQAISSFKHARSLLYIAKLLQQEDQTHTINNRSLKKLQQKLRESLENKLQGHLRNKHGGLKKRLRPRRLSKKTSITNAISNDKADQKRYQKEIQQVEIALAEIELKNKLSAKKSADNLNQSFSAQSTTDTVQKHDNFSSNIESILKLADSQSLEPARRIGGNSSSKVMNREQYVAKSILPILYRYCSEVIDQCMEEKALRYIEEVITNNHRNKKIPDQFADQIKQKIEKQQKELEIFTSKKTLTGTEKSWLSLTPKQQNHMKNSIKKSAATYVKEARRKSGAPDTPVTIFENKIKKIIHKSLKKELLSPPYQTFGEKLLQKYSGDMQKVLTAIQDISDKETMAHKEILSNKLKNVKNIINHASNQCYIESHRYRQSMSFYIKSELQRKHSTDFNVSNKKSYYRAVGTSPEKIFNTGFMPALLSRLSYQKGLLNEPYINDSAIMDENVGWTGGVVSLADNFLHSAQGIYTTTTGENQKSRWVYLVLPTETADVSQHLHIGADPVAMDAREVITPCITKKQVIACRESKPDGSLGETIWNPEASLSLKYYNNDDFVHFLNARHLKELEEQDASRTFNKYTNTPDTSINVKTPENLAEAERKNDYDVYRQEMKSRYEKPMPRFQWEHALAKDKQERIEMYLKRKHQT